jgi:hypothetical protein
MQSRVIRKYVDLLHMYRAPAERKLGLGIDGAWAVCAEQWEALEDGRPRIRELSHAHENWLTVIGEVSKLPRTVCISIEISIHGLPTAVRVFW